LTGAATTPRPTFFAGQSYRMNGKNRGNLSRAGATIYRCAPSQSWQSFD